MLKVIDEFTHILRGVPGQIRPANGPEFIASAVPAWIAAVGARTAHITPGSPSEDGYCESFNAELRDELLDGEILYSLDEARLVIEGWRQHYNVVRPHSSFGYRPPAAEAVDPSAPTVETRPPTNQQSNRTTDVGQASDPPRHHCSTTRALLQFASQAPSTR